MKKILTVLMVMLLALAGCAGGYNRNYNGKMGKITTVNEKKLKEMFA